VQDCQQEDDSLRKLVNKKTSFGVELENSVKIWTYNRLRSSKDDDFGANRKGICDFLLVINSNFGPILHHFRDTANYWLKIAYFAYPVLFGTPFPIFPLEFHGEVKRQETSHGATLWWRLRDPNFNRLWLIHPCDRRTDRRRFGGGCLASHIHGPSSL